MLERAWRSSRSALAAPLAVICPPILADALIELHDMHFSIWVEASPKTDILVGGYRLWCFRIGQFTIIRSGTALAEH